MFEVLGATFGATLAGCLALVGTTGAAVYFFMKSRRNNSFQQMQTIISEEIRSVRELVMIRDNFKSEVPFADDRKIPYFNVHVPGSDRKFLITYSGTITCGCDLDKIRFVRDGNHVEIIVPPSRILDAYSDVNSFKIHYQDTGIFAKDIKLEEQNKLIAEDLESQKQSALQRGILARANEEVFRMLTSIIAKHGLNQSFNVEIIFGSNYDTRRLNSPQQN